MAQPVPATTTRPADPLQADPAAPATAATLPAQQMSQTGAIPAAGPDGGAQTGATASDQAFGAPAGQPEIAATNAAMGANMVTDMNKANDVPGSGGQYDVHHGIHYWYNYQNECVNSGHPEMWDDKFRSGHSQATQFVQPYEANTFMDWALKPGQSASAAVKAWLAGATIAECNSSVVAMEIDTLRGSIGDQKFDKMFGSADATEDAAVPYTHRMHIKPGIDNTPVANYMKSTQLARDAQAKGGQFGKADPAQLEKELIPGQWYYFYNHPKYLLKHPGGAWQGENSLYMGKNDAGERTWAGLGASGMTEDAMVDEMVSAYNQPRDDYDNRVLKEGGQETADGTFNNKLYDPASGSFPDTVGKNDILTSQPYAIGHTTRSGGFMATAGQELDQTKVQKTRDEK